MRYKKPNRPRKIFWSPSRSFLLYFFYLIIKPLSGYLNAILNSDAVNMSTGFSMFPSKHFDNLFQKIFLSKIDMGHPQIYI